MPSGWRKRRKQEDQRNRFRPTWSGKQSRFQAIARRCRAGCDLPSGYQPGTRLPGIVTANALTGIKEINLAQVRRSALRRRALPRLSSITATGERAAASHASTSRRWSSARISARLWISSPRGPKSTRTVSAGGAFRWAARTCCSGGWEPRFKAIVAVATGIQAPVEASAAVSGGGKGQVRTVLTLASEKERAGRAAAGITTLQAWCPEPQDGCVLPVKEAFDWYAKQARASFAPNVREQAHQHVVPEYAGGQLGLRVASGPRPDPHRATRSRMRSWSIPFSSISSAQRNPSD